LAKVAFDQGKSKVSDFLIKHEKDIENKKIPFMLEVKQYKQALSIVIEEGDRDPKDINRVIMVIIKQTTKVEEVVKLVAEVPDGLRHLRNFAKKRKNLDLLKAIFEYLASLRPEMTVSSGLQQSEFSEVSEILK
jgi:hypothetical protein